jgi:biopolymer transport protein ExbD
VSHGPSEKCEPNLVPLLDLVLQLVMFFMLCANFVMEQVNDSIKLPQALAAKPLDRKDERLLFLNVNEKGQVLLSKLDAEDTLTLDNKAQVKAFMERRYKRDVASSPDRNAPILSTVIIRGDRQAKFEKIYDVMEGIRAANYKQVRFRAEVGDSR